MSPLQEGLVEEKCNNFLHPPQLSSNLRDNNILQVEEQQLDDALANSRNYWYQLASLVYKLRDSGLIPKFINPHHAIHRIPRLQTRSKRFHTRLFGISPNLNLCLEASSTWKLSANTDCDKLKKEISSFALLQVGTSVATPFGFTGRALNSWNGITEEKMAGPNYLRILTLKKDHQRHS